MCVCDVTKRWRRGGHEVAGWQQFWGDFVRKWRVCGCWVELYAYRAHFGASGLAPRRQQAQLLSRFRIRFHPSKPSDFYAPLDSTCQHHPFTTPPGVFSWQLDRIAITATSGYGVPCGLPGVPLTAIFLRPRCPAATRPRAVWRGPGQPTHFDSQLASETGPRQ